MSQFSNRFFEHSLNLSLAGQKDNPVPKLCFCVGLRKILQQREHYFLEPQCCTSHQNENDQYSSLLYIVNDCIKESIVNTVV